jgi:adenylate cyclase class 2
MAFEIESKYRLADQGAALRLELSRLGATSTAGFVVADTYLSHPSKNFGATGEAFRIRREGSHNLLTYKGPKMAAVGVKTRTEIEIGLTEGSASFDDAKSMFTAMGFAEVLTVEKFREPFKLVFQGQEMTVVLDNAGELGYFAEVELVIEDPSEVAQAEQRIKALAAELGLTRYEPKSYLRMWIERAGVEI